MYVFISERLEETALSGQSHRPSPLSTIDELQVVHDFWSLQTLAQLRKHGVDPGQEAVQVTAEGHTAAAVTIRLVPMAIGSTCACLHTRLSLSIPASH